MPYYLNFIIYKMKKLFLFSLFFAFVLSCGKDAYQPPEINFQITLTIQGNGTLSADSGRYPQGESFSIVATPADGHYFVGWQGDLTSDENPLTIAVTKNMSLTAIFLPIVELSNEVVVYQPLDIDENNVFKSKASTS